jgi:Caspase domain
MKSSKTSMSLLSLKRTFIVAGIALTLGVAAQAPTDVRIALVIGNAAYPGRMALTNPANDATAMSAALRNLGFTVIEAKDASRAAMEDAIKQMFTRLKGKQGIGMLYYAGHGLQVDWKNYMVPVDAKLQSSRDVPSQTVDVGDVIDALKAADSRMNVVVLDACRDNPFSEKGAKGLAPVDAPVGTFLAYATAPGNVAEDGSGSNGLYTKHLLAELQKPVSIENVFKRVRLNVRKESEGRQIPWESTSLEDDFSFAANKQVASVARGAQRDADFAEQKSAWDKIKDSSNADDFYDFLAKYPSGLIAEIAQFKLDKFGKNGIIIQSGKGQVANAPLTDRLRVGDEWVVKSTAKGIGFFGGDSSWTTSYKVTRKIENNIEVIGKPDGMMMPTTTQIMSPEGILISKDMGMMGKYEASPPQALVPLVQYQVGYKSSSRIETIRNGKPQGVQDFDMQVVGFEKLSVPAGTFDSYKIAIKTATTGAFGSTAKPYTYTQWYAQNTLIPLKSIFEMPGTPTTIEETLSIKRAGN